MQSLGASFTTLGYGLRRDGKHPIAMSITDRLQHLFVLGQTGTGKSTLLAQLVRQDAAAGRGFCLVDPHGDLAAELHETLKTPHQYWDVADPNCHLGYNPLTTAHPTLHPLIASGLIEAMKKQWADAWGVRMEHLLRYAILALLVQPNADLRDITRLFFDKSFRSRVIARVTDQQVLAVWREELPSMNYRSGSDGVAPIANKLGAFLAHPLVRRSVCEPEQPLRFRQIMDKRQGLIVNLGKGLLGSDTANVLGGLIVSSLMHAALSRRGTPHGSRVPFCLYVDEFHAFTTSAFANLLSEIRKYGVAVTLAQQYLQQSEREVFAAIAGNVGSLMAFRVGPLDAPLMSTQLVDIAERDLINLPNHRAFAKLMVSGQHAKAFSFETMPPKQLRGASNQRAA